MEKVSNQSDLFDLYENYLGNRPIYAWRSFGLYDDDFIEMIPAHWFDFHPVNDIVFIFSAGLNAMLAGHGLFVILFLIGTILCWKTRNSINCLLVNLLVCDLIMTGKNFLLVFNSLYRGPALGEIGIKIDGLLGGLSNHGSILSLVAIWAEAHSTIVFESGIKLPGVSAVILGIWIVASFFSIIPFFGVFGVQFKADGLLTSGTFDYWETNYNNRLFTFGLLMTRFYIPLGLFRSTYKDMSAHVSVRGIPSDDSAPQEIFKVERKINYLQNQISNMKGEVENLKEKVAVVEENISNAKRNVEGSNASRKEVAYFKRQTDHLKEIIWKVQVEAPIVKAEMEKLKVKVADKNRQYGILSLKLIIVWLVTSIPYEIISGLQVLGFKEYISPELFAICVQWSLLRSYINSLVIMMSHPENI